jgi:hypothetical protein
MDGQAWPAAISDHHYLDNNGLFFLSHFFISPVMDGAVGGASVVRITAIGCGLGANCGALSAP